MEALVGARVFDGDRLLDGHAVLIDGPKIVRVVPAADIPAIAKNIALSGLLAPGFIDVQVNGGGGVLFNDFRGVEGISAIGAAHRRYGTTGFLPTFISDTPERMAEAVAAAREAMRAGVPGFLGIHLEGPWLNPARKGVHQERFLRDMNDEDVALVSSPGLGRVLVTLAPERVPAETIAALSRKGVVIAAGHTAADPATIAAARAAGLTGFTHLFNAMPPLAGREPGPVGAAFDDADAFCGLIVDLHHVDAVSLRAALAARGWERMMLVTDAMSTVGSDLRSFDLHGRKIARGGGRLTTEEGRLAGSDLDMATAVRNAVTALGLPIEATLHMASRAPAAFLGLGRSHGRIAAGHRADLVLLDDDLNVVETWIGGQASA